ncbi:substrate-binding domain-containing protein [Ruania alba]|uniref:Transcriptional regulator, LacI family n=1 Tax=Ruania alba TaxID=648782 RepID=A0A1H5NDJ5_9MICO|nr:substrate-binding domain-containing protein [Ruania alba]SEE99625.1 transcriptional regulator, LacI family [Ruania alba]
MATKKRAHELGVAAVAKRAGVSTATVSNTLNRPHMVAPATQARVRAAIEELQFVPNRSASALRNGSGRLIGLVVPDIVNPFYAAIAKVVATATRERGYVMALCVSGDDAEVEMAHFTMLAEQRAAGAIVVPLGADTSRLARLRLVDAHPVLVDRRWPVDDGCSVAIDDERGGFLAVRHLLETTTGAVAIINGPLDIPQCLERETGARAALGAAGLDPDQLITRTVAEMTIEAGETAALELASQTPGGVFTTNDQLAVGAIRGFARAGVRVPDEVSVVGYGDLALATESLLPLTTIRQPKDLLGRSAVDLLLGEIESAGKRHHHEAVLHDPSLVVRSSAP